MHEALSLTDRTMEGLDGQIIELTRLVRGYERDRQDRIKEQRWAPPTPEAVDPQGYLEPARRRTPMPSPA